MAEPIRALEIRTSFPEFRRAFERVPGRLTTNLRAALGAYALEFVTRTLPRKRLSGRPGLMRRSGQLAGSFTAVVVGRSAAAFEVRIFSRSRYARIHEFGGTIRARRAPLLVWRGVGPYAGRWFSKKQVRIPARLRLFVTWREDADRRNMVTRAAAVKTLQEFARTQGPA